MKAIANKLKAAPAVSNDPQAERWRNASDAFIVQLKAQRIEWWKEFRTAMLLGVLMGALAWGGIVVAIWLIKPEIIYQHMILLTVVGPCSILLASIPYALVQLPGMPTADTLILNEALSDLGRVAQEHRQRNERSGKVEK
ncbi:hypothetical protein RAS12_30900 (plasmid) [Achromobacter seleniivolatilans]|uniref:Uncharacterized protein n=1 Tax=Achromobacter seleniivolatilans TaxID=3047478 RepID=A0ABY9MCY6_9BURK|nr:hypothetical protein [Achromobacter sp. R39]WMD24043.1 hypothetical protein RAS12_30900 [Achromobacter sp. R39]